MDPVQYWETPNTEYRILFCTKKIQISNSILYSVFGDFWKPNNIQDDWIHLIFEDMNKFNIYLSDEQISLLKKLNFKKIVKSKMRMTVSIELENIKQGHSKVRYIQHYCLKYTQPYPSNPMCTNKQTFFFKPKKQICQWV